MSFTATPAHVRNDSLLNVVTKLVVASPVAFALKPAQREGGDEF